MDFIRVDKKIINNKRSSIITEFIKTKLNEISGKFETTDVGIASKISIMYR